MILRSIDALDYAIAKLQSLHVQQGSYLPRVNSVQLRC